MIPFMIIQIWQYPTSSVKTNTFNFVQKADQKMQLVTPFKLLPYFHFMKF